MEAFKGLNSTSQSIEGTGNHQARGEVPPTTSGENNILDVASSDEQDIHLDGTSSSSCKGTYNHLTLDQIQELEKQTLFFLYFFDYSLGGMAIESLIDLKRTQFNSSINFDWTNFPDHVTGSRSLEGSFVSILKSGNMNNVMSNQKRRVFVTHLFGRLMDKVKDITAMPNLYVILEKKGFQNLSLTYSILSKEEVATRWVKVMPIKINVFAWRVHLDKLPTRLNLSLKCIDISIIVCPLCHASVESGSHIFFSCPMARQLWRKLMRWWELEDIDLASYDNWLLWLNSSRVSKRLKEILEGVCYVKWWLI
ncbi:RNA-directed DNA polymerase, eukaryota [Tanacetum coccineum]|uniref:RNA-directed DNA polymerase, eukaryota n=1 Tax=Tanacetum coccineum TaxID=301880 RepID=A0ABQ4ZJ80_9ASTR